MRPLLNSRLKYPLLLIIVTFILVCSPLRRSINKLLLLIDRGTLASLKRTEIADKLKRENLLLSLTLERLRVIEEENLRLRKALELKKDRKIHLVAAQIVSFSPVRWQRSCFVNVGKKHGIDKGMYVINEAKHLLGRIEEANDATSYVVFLEDPAFTASVSVNKEIGLLNGSLSGAPRIIYIDANSEIKVGDTVNFRHPAYGITLPVGTIQQVGTDPNSLFLSVRMQPYSDLQGISEVFILK